MYKKGQRISLSQLYGYEGYEGRKGTVVSYDYGIEAYLVCMDERIDGHKKIFLFESEMKLCDTAEK